MRIIRGTLIIMALLAATSSALAHHSFAPFNLTAEKTLVGTIKQFDWTNPHTWIWIDVPNEKGVVETWGVEGMSPNFLARRGWSKTSFKPGDKATIVVRPMKDGSPGGMFVTATLSNGRKLTSGGAEPAAN
jgi:uncharacterized protein DUF6152